MGRVVPHLAQRLLRRGVPVHAEAGAEIPRLVKAALPQALGADRHPGHGIEFAGELLRRRPGHETAEAVQRLGAALELEGEDSLPHGVLIVQGRGAAAECTGAHLAAVWQFLFARLTQQCLAHDPSAEGTAPWKEEIQQAALELVQLIVDAHAIPSFNRRRRPLYRRCCRSLAAIFTGVTSSPTSTSSFLARVIAV